MNRTENNEMDLMLRSLARREAASSLFVDRTDEQASGPHLDTDELSLYAEHALPAATHARYTTHLADCSRCRKLVAELTSAAAVNVREHVREETAAGFRQTIRQLFSFPVLRYAVPALALFAVVSVGLIVFRQQQPSSFVAKNEPAAPRVVVTEHKEAGTPSQNTSETFVGDRGTLQSDSATNVGADQQAKTGKEDQSKAPHPGESVSAVSSKDIEAERAAAPVVQPSFAPEPTTPPAPKAQDSVADARKEAVERTESTARPQSTAPKEQADSYAVARTTERAQQEVRARSKAEDRENQVAASQTGAPASQPRRGLAKLRTTESGRGDVAGNKKADDEAEEIRSVGGRRFRRQGGVWVDTAYHSGVTVITVVRGSEQYRALVSDQPALRTIADELSGEVILVWKGRGYRIR